MWIAFHREFWWSPKPSVSIRYLPGQTVSVTRACADLAFTAKAATLAKNPKGTGNGPFGYNTRFGETAKEAGPAS